jgi:spermidine/putrescine-binding protein
MRPAFRTHPNILIDGKTYGVPWVWGIYALMIRSGKVKGAGSYAILSDPAYAERVALFDDAVTEIAVSALLTGQDINKSKDMKLIGDEGPEERCQAALVERRPLQQRLCGRRLRHRHLLVGSGRVVAPCVSARCRFRLRQVKASMNVAAGFGRSPDLVRKAAD